jgi:hypothetical protein
VVLGLVIAGGVAMLVLVGLLAAGVDLPGHRLRQQLGLAPSTRYAPCEPNPEQVRRPRGPALPTGAWSREAPMPVKRDEVKSVAVDGSIWLLGGIFSDGRDKVFSLRTVLAYDPATRRYVPKPDLPEALDHVAPGGWEGDVVVAGGYVAPHGGVGRVWRYTAADGKWQHEPAMPGPRAAAGAGVIDGRLYVAGGVSQTSFDETIFYTRPHRSLFVYDFASGRWSEGPPMPTGRHHVGSAVLDGKLYVVGGRKARDFSSPAVERFDPRSGRWQRLAPLPLGVGGPGVAVVSGRLVVSGGGDDHERWVTPAAWELDPRRGRWRRLPDMRVPRHGHTMTTVGGRVYAFGGSPCAGFGQTPVTESLAPVQ